jgi:hypothetical protein
VEALSYREGDWFAVPLPSGGFGIGLAARVPAGGRILLGYFFGKRFASLPNSEDIPPFDAGAAVLVLMFGDLHLMSGAWPVIRHSEGWTRDRWPLPAFGFKQDVGGKFWRVEYGDDLSVATMRRTSVSSDQIEGLPKDGLFGAGAIEKMLDSRTDERFIVHRFPVWRDRSDFIIQAQLEAADAPKRCEQLFARRLGDAEFEIDCIPFFLYGVALGDVVETAPSQDQAYVLEGVKRASGRSVFRVWFGDSPDSRESVPGELDSLGCLLEWSSGSLLAVDAADRDTAGRVLDFLTKRQATGELLFESGAAPRSA